MDAIPFPGTEVFVRLDPQEERWGRATIKARMTVEAAKEAGYIPDLVPWQDPQIMIAVLQVPGEKDHWLSLANAIELAPPRGAVVEQLETWLDA